MQHLPINTPLYQKYLISYKEWLATLGYNEQSCKGLPSKLREFFHFLEGRDIQQFAQISAEHTQAYVEHLQTRKNYSGEGGLSVSHINGHIGVLMRFTSYLKSAIGIELPPAPDYLHKTGPKERVILSPDQIKQLYDVTDESIIGMRDRAMLTIYYGCGMRYSEGARLTTEDLLFERKLIHVRKGKNGHQRYVPITKAGINYLQTYIIQARALLLSDSDNETALFINSRGKPLSKHALYKSFIEISRKAGISNVGLHTLRHSIATHLLQKKMDLNQIALFLGHRSLDSTQVYTHIVKEIQSGRY